MDVYLTMPLHYWHYADIINYLEILQIFKECYFAFILLFLAMDVQAFERLLGPCMEIMKRNIATYEEQLVALFGTNMDIVESSAWSKCMEQEDL